MSVDSGELRLRELRFRQVVWLFPLAYFLHVMEELPLFTDWARRYASPAFTQHDYLSVHLLGLAVAVAAPLLVNAFPNRTMIFLFFTFVFTPAVFFNVWFHAGATAVFRSYCPGLLTALTIYPPLFYLLLRRALSERLISPNALLISSVLAGLFHAADVSHNVFKVW